ncbi:MAG: YggS family pyridoxal phosphate-dependent enzyme [Desulfocapsaceae bacterium]|nr:YggS family pyridoxal phosphate-dependent enzyme [Desulfocapsaceae bacterium]
MIQMNIKNLKLRIAQAASNCGRPQDSVRLVAVSKRFPASAITIAQSAGQKVFGENYIQEAQQKYEALSGNVQFHFIGHLQSNKAAIAAEICTMVETVDRIKLAKILNKHLHRLDKTLDILVQVNIGEDINKSGIRADQVAGLLEEITKLDRLRPLGLMTMPPFSNDPEDSRVYFRKLKSLAETLGDKELFHDNSAIELSMGMTNDYEIAIEEGATLVRVGTAIFGQRPTKT